MIASPAALARLNFTARLHAAFAPIAALGEAVNATGSTNADLLARARQAMPAQPVVRLARAQTHGRGRLGRPWHSDADAGLWFSLALPLGHHLPAAGLTLACGAALAEHLRTLGVAVALKWPNDLLLDGGKLGGVLTEVARDGQGRLSLIVGIGINLSLPTPLASSGARPLRPAALYPSLPPLSIGESDALACQLARAAHDAVVSVQQHGFAPWRARFEVLLTDRDMAVELCGDGVAPRRGILLGVDEHGHVRLQTEHGIEQHAAGELSLRVAA